MNGITKNNWFKKENLCKFDRLIVLTDAGVIVKMTIDGDACCFINEGGFVGLRDKISRVSKDLKITFDSGRLVAVWLDSGSDVISFFYKFTPFYTEGIEVSKKGLFKEFDNIAYLELAEEGGKSFSFLRYNIQSVIMYNVEIPCKVISNYESMQMIAKSIDVSKSKGGYCTVKLCDTAGKGHTYQYRSLSEIDTTQRGILL